MYSRLIILIALIICASSSKAQNWEDFVDYFTTDEELAGEADWANDLEELQQLHLNPININTATPNELRALPFLSEKQIEDIYRYIDLHGGMHSLNELRLIRSISYAEHRFLHLFVYVDEQHTTRRFHEEQKEKNAWEELWKYPRHTLASRMDIPLYQRKGYRVENGYQGSPLYNKVYYKFETSRHISASLRAERDPGERGIDSYGAHLMLLDLPLSRTVNAPQSKVFLKSLVVGDFKVSFGQGLLLKQGFSMGKSMPLLRHTREFRAHTSTEETNFMRGIGTSLTFSDLTLSLFYSHRNWDATPNAAKEGEPTTIRTILHDGYHRTATEKSKKGILATNTLGGNMSWQRKGLHTGLSGYYLKTDKDIEPGTQAYRQIYPQGNHFGGISLDYSYEMYRWQFFGETSYAGTLMQSLNHEEPQKQDEASQSKTRKGIALIHGGKWRISQRYTLTALQRYYNHHYYSFYSSAISENGAVQNETGFLVRLDASPWDAVELSTYFDTFYNPWPRYGLKKSSGGIEGMTQMRCKITSKDQIEVRYKVKKKEYGTGTQTNHQIRLTYDRSSFNQHLHFKTSLLCHALTQSTGFALGQSITYKPDIEEPKWQISCSGLYFHTKDYNSRVYNYETNVSEMVYMPTFYGHGIHATGYARYKIWGERIQLELKYGITRYFDRKVQGSDMQTIYSPVKNDITAQIKLKI